MRKRAKSEITTTVNRPVSEAELAYFLTLHTRTIRKLTAKGVLHHRPDGLFDLTESFARYLAHRERVITREAGVGPYGEARAALTLEKAKVARIQRERLEGSMV